MITVLVTLIQNTALLLAMMVVFDLVTSRKTVYGQWGRQAVAGLIVGGLCIGLMIASFQLESGIIFDTRSVLLSLSGLFLGPLPTILAMVIASAYRLLMGGIAALPGTGVILATGTIGILWRHYRRGRLENISFRELYLFGVVVHIIMMSILMTLPREAAQRVIEGIGLPVMVVYPIATIALGWLLANRLQRENASHAIRESEKKYRLLFESNPLPMWVYDMETLAFLSVNDAAVVKYGYSREEFLRMTIKDIRPAEDVLKLLENVQLSTSGLYESGVWRHCKKDGSLIFVEITSYVIGFEGRKAELILSNDITERIKAEEKLRESEERLRLATEQSNVAVWEYDLNTYSLSRSPNHDRLYGIGWQQKWDNDTFLNAIHPDDREYSNNLIRNVVCANGPDNYSYDFRVIFPDHTIRWLLVNGRVIERNETGQGIKVRGTLMDITERKQFQEKLETLNAQLEQKVQQRTALLEEANKELEAFSYSVSHDLRAPLRHINGYVDMLNRKYYDKLDEKARHYLDTISGAATKMGTLIDDLLQFSRTGRKEISFTELDLNILVQEVLKELEPVINARKIKWDIQELPKVSGDYTLMKLVWTNLIDNAIKYTRNQPVAKISVGYKTEMENFVFCISDNGVGFDMKYANKLFGVFQRLHSQSEFEGTGIGLANVQRIIHKHSGRVWAEAEKDRGASFYFSLPKIWEERV
ncbi:MAG: PAS domain S-box protein [Bacteroidota bacterium]